MRLVSPSSWMMCLALASELNACKPSQPPNTPHSSATKEATGPAPLVDTNSFATGAHRLLRDGTPSPARSALLGACVSVQFGRANDEFVRRQTDRGLSALTGGLYLVRAGEFRKDMVQGADPALSAALSYLSPRGDEGRSLALLTMQAAVARPGSPTAHDAKEHLTALADWLRDTHRGGVIETLGLDERVYTDRALLEPTPEALKAAHVATSRWIDGAVALNEQQRPGAARPKREEAMAAFRAFRSGAESLVALYLRHGDAKGAFAAVQNSNARRVLPPTLFERLERAANGGDASAFRDLVGMLLSPEQGGSRNDPREDPELGVDPQLLRAGVWGAAVEAYRRDPTSMDVDMALASLLSQFGMPDVVPLVLTDGVGAHPDSERLTAALTLVLQTMLREDRAEDTPSARRVFKGAEGLLALADRPEFRDKIQPSASQVRFLMGTLETRSGNLPAARALYEQSIHTEPTLDALVALANIDRQAHNYAAALEKMNRAVSGNDAKREPIPATEAHIIAFDIAREGGATDRARAELGTALRMALEFRQKGGPSSRARAERLLARVLDRYGELAAAGRATERAFSVAGSDRQQIAAVMLDATSRAFLHHDVKGARSAVRRGLEADLHDDDLVYAALFLFLAEREAKVASDGTASRALQSIEDNGQWPSRLASWAMGRLKDDALLAAARTPGQKTEATFYTAMSARIAGGGADPTNKLRAVAQSTTIDLVEVQLARELTVPSDPKVAGPLPPGKIP